MSPLFNYPYIHSSLSLPSFSHLRSSYSLGHRHFIPSQKRHKSRASLYPLIEDNSAPTDTESLNPQNCHFLDLNQSSIELASPHDSNTTRKCSLCHDSCPDHVKPYTFQQTAPAALAALNPHISSSATPKIFCYTCWVWIHNLSICWSCGETVSRKEERVSYGWCWWHWGCVSCLFCRVCMFLY